MTSTPCSRAAIAAARTSGARLGAPSRSTAAREERNRRVAEPTERGRRAARGARLFDRCDDATDDFRLGGVVRPDGIERRSSHGRVDVVEERDEHARVERRRCRESRGRWRPRAGRRARRSGPGRRRSAASSAAARRVSARGELGECAHAHLRIRVARDAWRSSIADAGRHDAGEQVEAEAHIACVVGPE